MSEIDGLEQRLSAALARIRAGVSTMAQADGAAKAAQTAKEDEFTRAREAELSVLRDALTARDAQIEALQAQAEAPAQAAAPDQDSSSAARIAELEQSLQERDDRIAELASFAELPEEGDAPEDQSAKIAALEQELAAAKDALSKERDASTELETRVGALKERLDSKLSASEGKDAARAARMEDLDMRVQRLTQVNADLRAINGRLRQAMTEGLPDAGMVNRAMQAELEALSAAREAEAAEVSAILSELKPLVTEAK